VALVTFLLPVSPFVSVNDGRPTVHGLVESVVVSGNEYQRREVTAYMERLSARFSEEELMAMDVSERISLLDAPYKATNTKKILLESLLFQMPLTFFFITLFSACGQYRRFVRERKPQNAAAPAAETALLAELCGDRHTPALYRNPLAPTPMLIGLFRPAIILPDRDFTDEQLKSILLHELTHLRRSDVLVKWLAAFACAVHWFNPLVWLLRREIDRACELACDEAVVRKLDPSDRQRYGDTLLRVAAEAKAPRAVLSTTLCEEKKALAERLVAIARHKRITGVAIALSVALLALVGTGVVLLGAGNAQPTIQTVQMQESE
jgi:beta-lactamase regulating signal transducer with metallopeptidase domain